jgi:predicted phosphate transport protein (TIGR00153 family)
MQSLIRWLLPKEDHFFGYLEKQAVIAHEAAVALAELSNGSTPSEVADKVAEIERRGDAVVREMEEALAKTFVTPIDREDLQRICQELDDVADVINLAARYFHVYGAPCVTEPMHALMAMIVDATRQLQEALPKLRKHDWPTLMEVSRSLRALEKKGDDVFREGVSALFHDDAIQARDLMRQKEILEDLENAIDRCERVANTLANFSVKHG